MQTPGQTSPAVLSIAIVISVVVFTFVLRFIISRSGRMYGPFSAELPADRARLAALQSDWRAPEELVSRSTPRDVRYTGAAWTSFVLVGVLSVGLIVFSAFLYRSLLREQEDTEMVAREGVAVAGQVVARSEHQRRSSSSFRVTYTYLADGNRYTSTTGVDRATYARLPDGATIAVRYAPTRPSLSRIEGGDRNPPWVALLLLLPVTMLSVLPISVARQRRLLAWGRPAPAIVTRVVRVKGGLAVRYQFLDISGSVATGNGSAPVKNPPGLGDTIAILYDPDRSARSGRFPMTMVRIAN